MGHSRRSTDRFRGWIPDLPGRVSLGNALVHSLLLFVSVHAAPKAVMLERTQASGFGQADERPQDQLFALLHPGKDFLVEDKKASVHPDIRVADWCQRADAPLLISRHGM